MKKAIIIFLLALLGMTQAIAQDYESLPYLSEGVKFVNEKVIVNNSDTVQYYYTYEMTHDTMILDEFQAIEAGVNSLPIVLCHYYTGNSFSAENDSIISGVFSKTHGSVAGNFNTYNNEALNKVIGEGRSYIPGGGIGYAMCFSLLPLYNGRNFESTIYIYTDFYASSDGSWQISEDDFEEMTPIDIGGQQLKRIAYLDEDGEPLAYIVQGIGFDSRDMGDLLTPFTRRPDPNADYQEWCGLSHVVKDGQIIYKGMRYRHGAFTGIDEVVTNQPRRPEDPQYYNLMGQPVGQDVPTTPGIYIHQGKKIVVR